MNTYLMSTGAEPLTMSSREVAELLENRHDDVRRSIKRLVERGVIVRPPLEDEPGTMRWAESARPLMEDMPKPAGLVERGVIEVPPMGEDQIETSHGRKPPLSGWRRRGHRIPATGGYFHCLQRCGRCRKRDTHWGNLDGPRPWWGRRA